MLLKERISLMSISGSSIIFEMANSGHFDIVFDAVGDRFQQPLILLIAPVQVPGYNLELLSSHIFIVLSGAVLATHLHSVTHDARPCLPAAIASSSQGQNYPSILPPSANNQYLVMSFVESHRITAKR